MDKFSKQEGSKIAELIEKGREQGFLTYDDVNDHLPDDISDPDQVEEIIGMINDLGLQVHEKAPDLDTLMLRESENTDDIALEQAAEALAAVEKRDDEIGKNSILELMKNVDELIPQPDRPKDKDFLITSSSSIKQHPNIRREEEEYECALLDPRRHALLRKVLLPEQRSLKRIVK